MRVPSPLSRFPAWLRLAVTAATMLFTPAAFSRVSPPTPANPPADGLRLENFAYPFPVQILKVTSQQQELEMAFMELKPPGETQELGVVLLLHGKNFSGAYWEQTAIALRRLGFRVIMPDQIGFGKSSKPTGYQFTFHQLATHTLELLRSRGITRAHVVGHSMGGMLATRFALMFPDFTHSLTLVNPIGLEDWSAKGVPYRTPDALFQDELQQTPEKIRAYQQSNYYGGHWRPDYDRWVELLVTFTRSAEHVRVAWVQALISEMIYTQPVVYEFSQLRMPTLLIIGQRDRTAPGRELAPEARRKELGNYSELGSKTTATIPNAKLVPLDRVGHLPHIEAFSRFFSPLSEFLASAAADGPAP